MKIALDFDNTITADPTLWAKFAQLAISRGHEVVIVTSRHPSMPCFTDTADCGLKIIYCAWTAKRKHYQADVWIDDDPKHIDQDHAL